mgnify:CR=1 FL=1
MKVSIISYAFSRMMQQGKVDIFGYLETVKYRFGLTGADIWNGMLTSLEPDYLAKVKDALCERELALANLACDRCHVWEDDADLGALIGRPIRLRMSMRNCKLYAFEFTDGLPGQEVPPVRLPQAVAGAGATGPGGTHRPDAMAEDAQM